MGLLILYVGVYVEQARLQCDHVVRSRDAYIAAIASRDLAINVTSRRARVSYESAADDSLWDYNWDSYV